MGGHLGRTGLLLRLSRLDILPAHWLRLSGGILFTQVRAIGGLGHGTSRIQERWSTVAHATDGSGANFWPRTRLKSLRHLRWQRSDDLPEQVH
jgi:hypothetical protein